MKLDDDYSILISMMALFGIISFHFVRIMPIHPFKTLSLEEEKRSRYHSQLFSSRFNSLSSGENAMKYFPLDALNEPQ